MDITHSKTAPAETTMASYDRHNQLNNAKNADQRAQELNVKYGAYDIPDGSNEFDPKMFDDGHVNYTVHPVEVGDTPSDVAVA